MKNKLLLAIVGSLLIATPLTVIKVMIKQITGVFGSGLKKQDYLDLLVMMFEVFNIARKDGLVGLENHIEHPEESEIFKRYPKFLKDHHAMAFFSDTMRVIISGAVQPYDLEDLMDNDIEVHHAEVSRPADALNSVADSLPGLGIVAAVLGVVLTMAAIDGPPEVIGHKIGAAARTARTDVPALDLFDVGDAAFFQSDDLKQIGIHDGHGQNVVLFPFEFSICSFVVYSVCFFSFHNDFLSFYLHVIFFLCNR